MIAGPGRHIGAPYGRDPWAGGGYAWRKPGQLTDWMPKLAAPSGRVHFAGEHTFSPHRA